MFLTMIFFNSPEHSSAQYCWPVQPLHESHELTGTFCEFRDTGSSDHFHNGIDIPKPDGSPVYPIANGRVTDIVRTGTDAYVRVERYCYLHIQPSVSLAIGDQVLAGQTILGTILAGQGHIHFIDGYYDAEINAIRRGGGFTPFYDSWPPQIRYVKFFEDGTDNEFSSNRVAGKVDIVVKVEEPNGPANSSASVLNNGTYLIGYKILSANGDTVKYAPPNNGLRFKFDSKPNNRYVHNVFFKQQSSTSSHVYTVTNSVTANGYWDVGRFPSGKYQVMVFTEDTRQNSDTTFVPVRITAPDETAPAAPILKFVRRTPAGFQIAWYPNSEGDIVGYRLYYSYDNATWTVRLNEDKLTVDSLTATFNTTFNSAIYFKLTAIDNAAIPNESEASDVYGIKMNKAIADNDILIVDGFDRTAETGGAWKFASHSFGFTYGQAMAAHDFSFDFCSNDAVIDSSINLSRYWAVIWFLGDEAESDETLSPIEQNLIDKFLNGGGRLFISGANLAWDLDYDSDCSSTTLADNDFLTNIVGADFTGKIKSTSAISGTNSWLFEGLTFALAAQILPVDSLDIIAGHLSSAVPCLWYENNHIAALFNAPNGIFGDRKLLYFAFPFEMIAEEEIRAELMNRILTFLLLIDKVDEPQTANNLAAKNPTNYSLDQNYPNPFQQQTSIRFQVPKASLICIKIYNLLGQQIRLLHHEKFLPGYFETKWNGRDDMGKQVPSGIYFAVLETDKFRQTKKLLIAQP